MNLRNDIDAGSQAVPNEEASNFLSVSGGTYRAENNERNGFNSTLATEHRLLNGGDGLSGLSNLSFDHQD